MTIFGWAEIALTLALGACTYPPPQIAPPPPIALWSKPNASYDAFLKDRSTCIQTTRLPTPVATASTGTVVGAYLFWPCMTTRGWRYDPAGSYGPPLGGEVGVVSIQPAPSLPGF